MAMSKKRRRFSPEFKFRVALAAAQGQRTLSELAVEYAVHPNQISQWKRQLLESGAEVFSRHGGTEQKAQEAVQTPHSAGLVAGMGNFWQTGVHEPGNEL